MENLIFKIIGQDKFVFYPVQLSDKGDIVLYVPSDVLILCTYLVIRLYCICQLPIIDDNPFFLLMNFVQIRELFSQRKQDANRIRLIFNFCHIFIQLLHVRDAFYLVLDYDVNNIPVPFHVAYADVKILFLMA